MSPVDFVRAKRVALCLRLDDPRVLLRVQGTFQARHHVNRWRDRLLPAYSVSVWTRNVSAQGLSSDLTRQDFCEERRHGFPI
jgi:hypothetical protein